jgi:hypothetical protein
MNNLLTLHLTLPEATLIAVLLGEASNQLMAQAEELDQDQREFLTAIQNLRKHFPVIQE